MLYIFIIFPVGKQSADITCSCNRISSIPVPVLVNFVMGTRYLKMLGLVLSVPNIRYPTLVVETFVLYIKMSSHTDWSFFISGWRKRMAFATYGVVSL